MVVGDVGKTIILDTGSDRTSDTVKIAYCKPDGTTGTWDATINGEDSNKIQYTTISGDIDQSGIWKLRSKIVGTGISIYGDIARVPVQNICGG